MYKSVFMSLQLNRKCAKGIFIIHVVNLVYYDEGIKVFCVVCLCAVSCVPNVASFSGLSIIDFLFGFLERLCSTTLNFCTDDIGTL
jgi:hypothetical protein